MHIHKNGEYNICFQDANQNSYFSNECLADIYGFIMSILGKLAFVVDIKPIAINILRLLEQQSIQKKLPITKAEEYISEQINIQAKCEHGDNFSKCYQIAQENQSFQFSLKCKVNLCSYIHQLFFKFYRNNYYHFPSQEEAISFTQDLLEILEKYGKNWDEEKSKSGKSYIKTIVQNEFVKYVANRHPTISLESTDSTGNKIDISIDYRSKHEEDGISIVENLEIKEVLEHLKEYLIQNWWPIIVYYLQSKFYTPREIEEKLAISESIQAKYYHKICQENPELLNYKNKIKKNWLPILVAYFRIIEKRPSKEVFKELEIPERTQRYYIQKEISKITIMLK